MHRGDANRLRRFRGRRCGEPAARPLHRRFREARRKLLRERPCRRRAQLRHGLRPRRQPHDRRYRLRRRPAVDAESRAVQLVGRHPLRHRDVGAGRLPARIPCERSPGRRDLGGRHRRDRARGCIRAGPLRHGTPGPRPLRGDLHRASHPARAGLQPQPRPSGRVRPFHEVAGCRNRRDAERAIRGRGRRHRVLDDQLHRTCRARRMALRGPDGHVDRQFRSHRSRGARSIPRSSRALPTS